MVAQTYRLTPRPIWAPLIFRVTMHVEIVQATTRATPTTWPASSYGII